jgi:hypothetical protein
MPADRALLDAIVSKSRAARVPSARLFRFMREPLVDSNSMESKHGSAGLFGRDDFTTHMLDTPFKARSVGRPLGELLLLQVESSTRLPWKRLNSL